MSGSIALHSKGKLTGMKARVLTVYLKADCLVCRANRQSYLRVLCSMPRVSRNSQASLSIDDIMSLSEGDQRSVPSVSITTTASLPPSHSPATSGASALLSLPQAVSPSSSPYLFPSMSGNRSFVSARSICNSHGAWIFFSAWAVESSPGWYGYKCS